MRFSRFMAFAGVSLLALGTPAFAQSSPEALQTSPPFGSEEQTADGSANADIVVTGTLLRGSAPVGSQQIGVTLEQIRSIGAANSSDLIAAIPQTGNFLNYVGVRGSSNFSLAVNRPTLRYLGNTSSSTNSTLLLVDGHRLPGMGISQTTPDLDAIPAAAIERVEIVTDGGSSTYGSDAVGGVMNMITRRRFDGIQVKGQYGFADNYQLANASVIAGKDWGRGSAYLVYDWSWHDELYGRDRDWSQSRDWVNNLAANRDCTVPNIQVGTATYALPGKTLGFGNRCDNSELATFYPRETKHSVFGSLLLDDGGPVSVQVKAYYINRVSQSDGGPLSLTGGVRVPTTNPYYIPIAGTSGDETFVLNLSPAYGDSSSQTTKLVSYGFTPSAKVKIGGWQLNLLGNFGRGNSKFLGQLVNTTPISTAAAAGTFNPADLRAATNAATLATARDWFQYGKARNELINFRAILDGALFTLPAGEVKVAVGAEYMHERYEGNNTRGATAAGLAAIRNVIRNRVVKSGFGEVNVPLLGGDMGGIRDLSITASGRYDEYSDFGHTFNPKIGVNFEPVAWLKLRGNWGKAFQAPGLSDLAQASAPTLNILPVAVRPFLRPGLSAGSTDRNIIVALGGTRLPLQPQKAKTWSAGFDLKPPIIENFGFGATYYSIDFKGAIAVAPIFDPNFYAQFPDNVVAYDAGNTALQAYLNSLASIATNASVLSALPLGIQSVYSVMDGRSANLQRVKTSGIDFYANYRLDADFGSLYANVAGTYIRRFKTQANPNAALIEQVHLNTTRLRVNTTLGTDIGDLRAQVTWQYSQGFAVTPTVASLQQTRVGDFNVFNLFFQYTLPGKSKLLQDLSLTLHVDNVLDQDPPEFRGAGLNSLFGVANGFTLGRTFKFGVSKKF